MRVAGLREGVVNVFSRHTTAAVCIQEDEPLLLEDLREFLEARRARRGALPPQRFPRAHRAHARRREPQWPRALPAADARHQRDRSRSPTASCCWAPGSASSWSSSTARAPRAGRHPGLGADEVVISGARRHRLRSGHHGGRQRRRPATRDPRHARRGARHVSRHPAAAVPAGARPTDRHRVQLRRAGVVRRRAQPALRPAHPRSADHPDRRAPVRRGGLPGASTRPCASSAPTGSALAPYAAVSRCCTAWSASPDRPPLRRVTTWDGC